MYDISYPCVEPLHVLKYAFFQPHQTPARPELDATVDDIQFSHHNDLKN